MSDMKIVLMHQNHVDDVVAIENETSAPRWAASTFITEINSPTHILLVSVEESKLHPQTDNVLGFVGGQLVGDELHIHSLAVTYGKRRQGIGQKLIKNLISVAKQRDSTSATLEVRVSNVPAISLYKKLGFIQEGIRQKYYADNGEDACIMWLHSLEEISEIK